MSTGQPENPTFVPKYALSTIKRGPSGKMYHFMKNVPVFPEGELDLQWMVNLSSQGDESQLTMLLADEPQVPKAAKLSVHALAGTKVPLPVPEHIGGGAEAREIALENEKMLEAAREGAKKVIVHLKELLAQGDFAAQDENPEMLLEAQVLYLKSKVGLKTLTAACVELGIPEEGTKGELIARLLKVL
jgi:hypothetical protein